MPITRRNGKYYWGSKGPFDTQAKAEEVAQAAYASGYKGSIDMQKQDEYGEYERYKKILENSPHGLATLREHHLGHKAIDQLAQEQLSDADFGGERRRIHVINWWDREHQMHPYNDWQRSGKRTRQTNKPYNPDAQIGLWDFHRNYLEDFIDYHNDQQKSGKIGGTAWENYGGEGAHPATSDLNNLKRVTERMMQQGIYNPHDVEDVPEDFPQYKAVQKLLNFVQKAEPEETSLEPAHWDISPNPDYAGAPCPHEVASGIKESGASDSDILNWLQALTEDLTVGAEGGVTVGAEEPSEEFSFTGDVETLDPAESFGVGLEAGRSAE